MTLDEKKIKREEIRAKYRHGDPFTAKINDMPVEGKVSFGRDNNNKTIDQVFFCYSTDKVQCGDQAENMLGYTKSWSFDGNITEIKIISSEVINNNYSIY